LLPHPRRDAITGARAGQAIIMTASQAYYWILIVEE
jgi:hypothetical protein